MENFTKCGYCKSEAIGEKRLGDEWYNLCVEHYKTVVGQFGKLFQ
jgi:hypothetical protein